MTDPAAGQRRSPERITSLANPRVKAAVRLRERREREATGLTIVDGAREILRALDAGVRVETAFIAPDLIRTDDAEAVARRLGRHPATIEVAAAVLEKIAFGDRSDGVVVVVVAPLDRELDELELPENPLIVIVERVEKPGNLGAMLRTADAAGVDDVVAADPVTDWGNPNVVRSSKGTVFSVPVAAAGTQEVLDWLRGNGIRLVATTPDTDTAHTDVDYRGSVAVAVGTEKEGLTDVVLGAADERVRIPMVGRVNSLNAATAAAVVVYEAVRQRSS